MRNLLLTPDRPTVNVLPRGRFLAKSEFEQGKYLFRTGEPKSACATDEQTDGWEYCQANGEKFGWQRNPAAHGEDAFWLGMMQQASMQESM
jgi:hypothetical protein